MKNNSSFVAEPHLRFESHVLLKNYQKYTMRLSDWPLYYSRRNDSYWIDICLMGSVKHQIHNSEFSLAKYIVHRQLAGGSGSQALQGCLVWSLKKIRIFIMIKFTSSKRQVPASSGKRNRPWAYPPSDIFGTLSRHSDSSSGQSMHSLLVPLSSSASNLPLTEFQNVRSGLRTSYEFNYTDNHHFFKKGLSRCSRGKPGKQPLVLFIKKYRIPALCSFIQLIAQEAVA